MEGKGAKHKLLSVS